jgi:PRTRC genetic system protein E
MGKNQKGNTMFAALKPLLGQCQSVKLIITMSGNDMTVTVLPTSKEASTAMLLPLSLTATPEELDEAFVGAITEFTGVRQSLADQIAENSALLVSAQKNAADNAKKKSSSSKSSPPELDGDDDAENDDPFGIANASNPGCALPVVSTKSQSIPQQSTSNLFTV